VGFSGWPTVLWSTLLNFGLYTKSFAPCQTYISALVIGDVRRVRRPLFGLSRIDSRSTGIECSPQVPCKLRGRNRVESSAESVHYSPLNSRPSRSDSDHAEVWRSVVIDSVLVFFSGAKSEKFKTDFLGNRRAVSHQISQTRSTQRPHLKILKLGVQPQGAEILGVKHLRDLRYFSAP
jgi:hypothetical protein